MPATRLGGPATIALCGPANRGGAGFVDFARLPGSNSRAAPSGEGGPASGRDIQLESFLVSPDAAALAELSRMLAAGQLRTRVARVLPLEQAAEGHRLAEVGGLHGKVVLTTG